MLTSGLPGLVLETQPEQLLIQTFPSVEIAFWEDQYFSPLKCRVGELVQKYFFIMLESLHIPIASIRLSGLNVFILTVEGVEPYNVRPIIFLGPRDKIGLH